MKWLMRFFGRRRLEEQLDKEVRFHIEQHAADLMARGVDPVEARRQAVVALGGKEQAKEECRDARGTRWAEDALRDIQYAVRTLRQKPGFAAVALCTLALGIGATTVVFTVINGVLFAPLPYAEPERLVAVHGKSATWNTAAYGEQNVAYYDFRDCQRETRSLDLTGWVFDWGTMSAPGDPEHVVQFEISSNLFSVLGVPVHLGRAFVTEEDRPGGAPVAIVSYEMWRRKFGGSSLTSETKLLLDGKAYIVVGVAAPGFRLDDEQADVYTPVGQNTARYMQSRGPHPVGVMGRLRAGATLAQAQAELATIGQRLARQYPDTNKGRSFDARILRPDVGDARKTLWLLLGAVGVVLLIACANIGSLLLARAVSREHELAMRVMLGASRGRLVRQCLTESAVLGLSGGLLGVLVAAPGTMPFVSFWPGTLPRADNVHLDWRVLVFAATVSLACGILFGLAPALRIPTRKLEPTLRAGGRTIAASSRRLHAGFVAAEIALAMVLLASATMLGRTLLRITSLDPGLDIHNVLVARTALSPGILADPGKTRADWEDILDSARRILGVEYAAAVDTVPMRQGNNQLGYWTSADVPPENRRPIALATSVTPDYLKVMGIPLLEGRFFDTHDRLGSEPVIVIDEVMARLAFGTAKATGKRFWIPDMGAGPFRVVGVVRHVRHWGLARDDQAPVRAEFYYPFAQVPDGLVRRWSELMSIAVRTNIPPLMAAAPLRRAVRGAGGDQVLFEIRTMEQLASASVARHRFLLLLFGIFAGLALLLACIGVYGVLAYLAHQRVPEIGVRMALGATSGDILRLMFGRSFGMIWPGVAAGACGALAAAQILKHLVDGMETTQPLTFVIVISCLIPAALSASFFPAHRASRVDPLRALRQE